jgi:hypothetical protein
MKSLTVETCNSACSSASECIKRLARYRICYAWLFWLCAMMSNAVVAVLIQGYLLNYQLHSGPILHDIGFELLPYISSRTVGVSIPDLCTLLTATLLVVNVVLTFSPSEALIVVRRLLCISGVAYFGRALSVAQTLFPNPDEECYPSLHPKGVTMSVLLIPFGGSITCADCFYSGHAIPITCALLTWTEYMRRNPFRYIAIPVSILAYSGIVVTHFHYTIDVFYGFIVTFITWRIYHFIISCPSAFQYFPLVSWWEMRDAVGPYAMMPMPGVMPIDLSADPRLVWSYDPTVVKPRTRSRVSPKQIAILIGVLVTLLPSWIAVYATTVVG